MPYLDTYSGPWTKQQAKHLLNRTTFGPSQAMIDESTALGLQETIDLLFAEVPLPDPPVKAIPDGDNPFQLNDPGALYGEPWIDADPFPNVSPPMYRNRILRSRSKSLYAWTFLQMHSTGINIREKMTLFWHNHFVVADITIPHREYYYYTLLRENATGNFKELTKDVTIDTGMLIYLSGTENTNTEPNENYARELLELFTIGKGALAAPGDYTNYTETDIVEMAKVLTGWRVFPVGNPNTLTAVFDSDRHTAGSKTLSYRFNNAIITENGDQEYRDLIDVIFQQDECSRFITRKLYRWFVSHDIPQEVEANIIEPLAQIIRDNNYEIGQMLQVMFSSDHFYETTACMIKSPVDLIMSASRGLSIEPPQGEVEDEYDHAYHFYIMCADIEQALYFHPDVAGWKAYYQKPQYDQWWINNLLLPKRQNFCQLMVQGGSFSYNDVNYIVTALAPVLDIAANIENSLYPDSLIQGLAQLMFNTTLTDDQVSALKDVLIPGLPDFEWTIEYGDYLNNPDDEVIQEAIDNKLRALISVMVQMSEFQLM